MTLSNQTQTLSFSEDINKLLSEINDKIAGIARQKWDAARFGAKDLTDKQTYFILVRYRDLLLMKANNSCCLSDYLIDDIISNIKQYLSSGKVQKFKKFQ